MIFSSKNKFRSEQDLAKYLISESQFLDNVEITQNTESLIHFCRNNKSKQTKLDAFMEEYGLSNSEGIALMCLAESIMRIPDDVTRDSLINEKLTSAMWSEHLGKAESFLVNSATWGLSISKEFLKASNHTSNNWLIALGKKIGESSIREGVKVAMQILSKEFVCAEKIEELHNSSWLKSHRCSFDMLGEASRNQHQSNKYFESYLESINLISDINNSKGLNNGISIKLSALYSKYDALHYKEVNNFLFPRVVTLIKEAMNKDVAVTIDAEEQDRLGLSLELMNGVALHKEIKAWPKLGLAVQAYGKRSLEALQYLDQLSQQRSKMHVRLVKGAYWDYEIKNSQVKGLPGYPVFTNKQLTDLSYLVAAKKLIKYKNIEASFATHNAHSIAAIMSLANQHNADVEFQRLYGMGELLYLACEKSFNNFQKTSIYCPIGEHKELLPYLVRRLLENGANSSFINKYLNTNIPETQLSKNPATEIKHIVNNLDISNLPLPKDLFMPRLNSSGLDMSEKESVTANLHEMTIFSSKMFKAKSISSKPFTNMDSIEALSKSSSNIIGITKWCDPESLSHELIEPSLEWQDLGLTSRSDIIISVAALLEEQKSKFLYLLMHEAGKTLEDAADEIREAVDFLRYYAQQAQSFNPIMQNGPTGEDNLLEISPKGIVLCISPWNFPLAITVGQIAAALVTGNTVISKPSEHTSLISYEAMQLFYDQGVPCEALHLLLGDGFLGQQIVEQQQLDLVVFTGSFKTAKNIHKSLADKDGKIVSLIAETGGLNSMIVDSSALLERACDDIVRSAFNSAGQRCSALRLLMVHEDIYLELIEMLKGVMDDLIIGNPEEASVDIGPIISEQALKNLKDFVQKNTSEAISVYQTPLPKGLDGSWFPPTLIEVESMQSLKDEYFGPILHVIRFSEETLEDSLNEVNKKGYALTFGIHTRIDSRALDAAKKISAGNIYINRDIVGAAVEAQPFGGKNLSGTGFKAGGPNYLMQFIDETTISINTVAIGGNVELLNETD